MYLEDDTRVSWYDDVKTVIRGQVYDYSPSIKYTSCLHIPLGQIQVVKGMLRDADTLVLILCREIYDNQYYFSLGSAYEGKTMLSIKSRIVVIDIHKVKVASA